MHPRELTEIILVFQSWDGRSSILRKRKLKAVLSKAELLFKLFSTPFGSAFV